MAEAAIEIRDLVKTYAAQGDAPPKQALKGVSFDVPEGGIFGLLGPNGAGKSTLINIMAGLVMKTSGTIRIWGHDIDRDHRNAKMSIGIVPQEIVFDPFFTPFEVLENQGGMYGIARHLRRSEDLLRAVHLVDKRNAYSRSLSGGMKRRLLIAKAMVHSPPILVLDEPTAGVDVELRRQLWELVGELNADGVTVVLTTHYLEEAEQLCDRIAIIDSGRIIASGPPRDLIAASSSSQSVLLRTTQPLEIESLGSVPGIEDLICENSTVTFRTKTPGPTLSALMQVVTDRGVDVLELHARKARLEDVFLALTSEDPQ